MKKPLILSMISLLSACSCLSSDPEYQEEQVVVSSQKEVYQTPENENMTSKPYYQPTQSSQPVYQRVAAHRVRTTQPDIYYVPAPRQAPVESYQAPAPRYIASAETYQPAAPYYSAPEIRPTNNEYQIDPNSPCKGSVRETREPVEIVYKKTTYKTVYEPKTFTDVSYEKEPYRAAAAASAPIRVSAPSSEVIVQEDSVQEYIDAPSSTREPLIMPATDRK